jgi:hypothetical protein
MHVGHELSGAGMLILAAGGSDKPLDYSELERWTRWASSGEWRHDAASGDSVKSRLIVLHFTISEAPP